MPALNLNISTIQHGHEPGIIANSDLSTSTCYKTYVLHFVTSSREINVLDKIFVCSRKRDSTYVVILITNNSQMKNNGFTFFSDVYLRACVVSSTLVN